MSIRPKRFRWTTKALWVYRLPSWINTILTSSKSLLSAKVQMVKTSSLREREREFNRTFVSLYDVDSRDDKECRRRNQWQEYLRQNNNQAKVEPIDYFFPLSTTRAAGTMNGLLDGKETYRRILIQRKAG